MVATALRRASDWSRSGPGGLGMWRTLGGRMGSIFRAPFVLGAGKGRQEQNEGAHANEITRHEAAS
jgi:hypothetical protein